MDLNQLSAQFRIVYFEYKNSPQGTKERSNNFVKYVSVINAINKIDPNHVIQLRNNINDQKEQKFN